MQDTVGVEKLLVCLLPRLCNSLTSKSIYKSDCRRFWELELWARRQPLYAYQPEPRASMCACMQRHLFLIAPALPNQIRACE